MVGLPFIAQGGDLFLGRVEDRLGDGLRHPVVNDGDFAGEVFQVCALPVRNADEAIAIADLAFVVNNMQRRDVGNAEALCFPSNAPRRRVEMRVYDIRPETPQRAPRKQALQERRSPGRQRRQPHGAGAHWICLGCSLAHPDAAIR